MWKNIINSDIKALEAARIQLHQAAQLIAAIGRSYNDQDPGDSFATLRWDNHIEGLVGKPLEPLALRAYLRLEDLTIGLLGEGNSWSVELDQQNINEARSSVQKMVADSGLDLGKLTFQLPYEIPEYQLAKGIGTFDSKDSNSYKELSNFYANADNILQKFAKNTDASSEVTCWPHHFDIATLVTLVKHKDPEKAKSIGVGLSPGDDNYNEPYFYITPWPYPDKKSLPQINSHGHWHSNGWVGRVLAANEISRAERAEQEKLVEAFVFEGFETIKSIM